MFQNNSHNLCLNKEAYYYFSTTVSSYRYCVVVTSLWYNERLVSGYARYKPTESVNWARMQRYILSLGVYRPIVYSKIRV